MKKENNEFIEVKSTFFTQLFEKSIDNFEKINTMQDKPIENNIEINDVKHMENFDENDWAHLHDAILDGSRMKINYNQKELEKAYHELPDYLKDMAVEFGMNDTPFRDGVWEIYRKSAYLS